MRLAPKTQPVQRGEGRAQKYSEVTAVVNDPQDRRAIHEGNPQTVNGVQPQRVSLRICLPVIGCISWSP